jgi:hypothetical protein
VPRARAVRRLLLAAALLAVLAPAARAGQPTAGSDGCGPIDPAGAAAAPAALAEPGVAPSSAAASDQRGEITSLPPPAPGGAVHPTAVAGEALVALPKGPNGAIPTDFELAPRARVASSFFSPVICATVVRVVGPPELDVAALVPKLPKTAVAVANEVYVTSAAEIKPLAEGPDPYRPLQYALDQAGVDAASAVGDGRGARVALLDSAPDAAHRDLAGVRVIPLPDAPPPAVAVHGTLMAGIVRAVAHNAFGIAGMAPGSDVFAIPVCTPAGATASDECRLYDLLRGVDVAWANGAQIVNLSLVGPPNPLLRKAMDRMEQLGVLLVAAVGNEGVSEPRYPAAYPSVIGVGAVDRAGRLYARGNRGPDVEILAPGVEILSTVPGGSFAFGDGTSLAAANVTGLLAVAVGASGDASAARSAFFAAAQARAAAPGAESAPMPTACDVLGRLGRPCPTTP